jgi:hypothetical protein
MSPGSTRTIWVKLLLDVATVCGGMVFVVINLDADSYDEIYIAEVEDGLISECVKLLI